MLWVVPLALYLLTFVFAFSRRQLVSFDKIAKLHPIMVIIGIGFLLMYNSAIRVSWLVMGLHLLVFAATALMCHTRLALTRPPGEGRNVTEFYLMMSIGGALGGVLNAFIVPNLLDRLIEYPLMLVLSCLMNPAFAQQIPKRAKSVIVAAFLLTAGYAAYGILQRGEVLGHTGGAVTNQMILFDTVLFTIILLLSLNIRAVFAGALVLLLLAEVVMPRDVLVSSRNFYGVIKVFDRPMAFGNQVKMARYMYHGTTTHGMQILDKQYEKTPTAYFTRGGPVGDIFNLYNPKNIAVLGLGVGTLNCYSTPENAFTFYEIDPGVLEAAQDNRLFTFMSACKGRRPPVIILGDGRLELNRSNEKFDLIMLDAFSSDTIPTHLLTKEALQQYLEKLAPGGLMLFNLSNRYFDLATVLTRSADELGLKSRYTLDLPGDSVPYAAASRWIVMSRPEASLDPLNDMGWVTMPVVKGKIWTDDYTDLLDALIR